MGKTSDLFKKIRDTEGIFHAQHPPPKHTQTRTHTLFFSTIPERLTTLS